MNSQLDQINHNDFASKLAPARLVIDADLPRYPGLREKSLAGIGATFQVVFWGFLERLVGWNRLDEKFLNRY